MAIKQSFVAFFFKVGIGGAPTRSVLPVSGSFNPSVKI